MTIAHLQNRIYRQLEATLLPVKSNVFLYFVHAVQFCALLPLAAIFFTIALFSKEKESPILAFAKRPKWNGDISVPMSQGVPIKVGLSTSDIQDSGPHKPEFAETNWGEFYRKFQEKMGPVHELPDTLSNPEKLIGELQFLGVRNWRTSINLMPKKGKCVDPVALKKYCDFFRALRDAGVEVMVTLNHFVHPDDFSWLDADAPERLGHFADEIAGDLFAAGIRKIVVTNEANIVAFQGYVMGAFPPQKKLDFTGAAKLIENMMRAQVIIYQKLKAKHPEFQIGLTHDPIRFRHYHKCNPLFAPSEMIFCHYLTEINHTSLMRFLQTGKFSLRVPFFCDCSFEIPEFADKKTRPLDFIGLQYYTDPLIRFPKGSVTRVPGEKLTTYQYRMYPQGIASALEEMGTLGIPVEITEVGCDTGVNHCGADKERAEYFNKLFQAVQQAIDHGVNVRSIYFWTKDKSWEWHEGMRIDFSLSDEKGPRGTALWLKDRLATSRF